MREHIDTIKKGLANDDPRAWTVVLFAEILILVVLLWATW